MLTVKSLNISLKKDLYYRTGVWGGKLFVNPQHNISISKQVIGYLMKEIKNNLLNHLMKY